MLSGWSNASSIIFTGLLSVSDTIALLTMSDIAESHSGWVAAARHFIIISFSSISDVPSISST